MNTKYLLFFLSIFIFAKIDYAQSDEYNMSELICKESQSFISNNRIQNTQNKLSSNNDFDMKYYRFEWNINPNTNYISGTATSYFLTKIDNISTLEYDLSSSLVVDSIQYHQTNISFTQSGSYGLSIQLPNNLPINTLDSVSITYHGMPPSNGFGSFIQSTHNNTPILWTLSEPFGAQDWWPCKNGLTDKIDSIDVYVTTPSNYKVASNGILKEEYIIDTNTIFHWKHSYQIAPYLIAIAVTDYTVYNDTVHLSNGVSMPMMNYVYPENITAARTGTNKLVKVLEFFDSLFINYGFYKEKYGHAQFGWGGGMEHQTMSFVINFNDGLLAHELGHQWFGDLVTCGSWQDIWLNEGWATYLEGLSRQRFNDANDWLSWKTSNRNSATFNTYGSVKVDDTFNVSRIFNGQLSYSKGAYLLHMLRWKLGDVAFFQATRNYLNDKKYSFARTPEFKAHLEAVSGINLTDFFKDWYEGQGYPSYHFTWQQKADGTLLIKINQTTSNNSVDFYEMPIPIQIKANGIDTIIRLEHTTNNQIFSLKPNFIVTSIAFDPDLWILSKDNSVVNDTISVGFVNHLINNKIPIYPNPVNDVLNIDLSNIQIREKMIWKIYNSFGSIVKSGNITSSILKISISDLPSGSYFIECFNDIENNVNAFVKY